MLAQPFSSTGSQTGAHVPSVYYRRFWQNFQSACGWTCMCVHVGGWLAVILLLTGHETTFCTSSVQVPVLQVVTWVPNSGHRQLHLSGVSERQHGVLFGYWKPWTRTDQCFNFASSPRLDFVNVTGILIVLFYWMYFSINEAKSSLVIKTIWACFRTVFLFFNPASQ